MKTAMKLSTGCAKCDARTIFGRNGTCLTCGRNLAEVERIVLRHVRLAAQKEIR